MSSTTTVIVLLLCCADPLAAAAINVVVAGLRLHRPTSGQEQHEAEHHQPDPGCIL